jgi:hypothetical protein
MKQAQAYESPLAVSVAAGAVALPHLLKLASVMERNAQASFLLCVCMCVLLCVCACMRACACVCACIVVRACMSLCVNVTCVD